MSSTEGFATGFGTCRHSGAGRVSEGLSDLVTHAYIRKTMHLDIKNRCLSGAAELKLVTSHEFKQQNFWGKN